MRVALFLSINIFKVLRRPLKDGNILVRKFDINQTFLFSGYLTYYTYLGKRHKGKLLVGDESRIKLYETVLLLNEILDPLMGKFVILSECLLLIHT